jgi:hypothetical protein
MYRPREERPSQEVRLIDEQLVAQREALAEQQEELEFEAAWTTIVRTPIGDHVVKPIESNRSMIRGWSEGPGEGPPNFGWFKRLLEEDPRLANALAWESADKFDPAKRKQLTERQLVKDRQTLADACRQLHIGNNEANFGIIRSTLGENFSIYQVQQAIQCGAVRVSPATQQELEQWAAESVETHNQFLLNADSQTLRTIARREGAERHQAALQAEADRQLQASQARDAAIGFPPLPAVWKGEPLDAGFIKRAASETLRLLNRRFGAAAVNARLCGK